MVEDCVVPIEAAAALGDVGQERKQDRAHEGAAVAFVPAGVSACVNRRGRLALQLLEGHEGIGQRGEPARARVHVVADERPVVVERSLPAVVLLEREGDLGAAIDLPREERKTPDREETKRAIQVRSAHGHELPLRPRPA